MNTADEFETTEKNEISSDNEIEATQQNKTTSDNEVETTEKSEISSDDDIKEEKAKKNSIETDEHLQPSTQEFETELKRERYKTRYKQVFRSTIYLLLVAAAIAILVVTLWMPVIEIYGKSMTPTLSSGEIVVLVKTSNFKTGDIIAFYYNNKILVKRVIAQAGDWVDITKDGRVIVNGKEIDEPYISEKSLGECDIKLPYQVPDERVFVMGDHRSVSVDSRSSQIGCIADEQVVGRITFRVWPFKRLGKV
jgi:signal peptidase I